MQQLSSVRNNYLLYAVTIFGTQKLSFVRFTNFSFLCLLLYFHKDVYFELFVENLRIFSFNCLGLCHHVPWTGDKSAEFFWAMYLIRKVGSANVSKDFNHLYTLYVCNMLCMCVFIYIYIYICTYFCVPDSMFPFSDSFSTLGLVRCFWRQSE